MAYEVILPRVDMDMETGKISRWAVKPGETVKKGQLLFEIETAKAAMEIEAEHDGILGTVLAQEGDELPVGQVVAYLYAPGEAVQDAKDLSAGSATQAVAEAPVATSEAVMRAVERVGSAMEQGQEAGLRATPLARRLAKDQGLDLASIAGSGPRGRVQAADVEASAAPGAPTGEALAYQWRGAAKGPVVVLLHGFAADAAGFQPLFAPLEADNRLLLIDLPGHGKSSGVAAQGFAGLVAAVKQTLIASGAGRVHLVGHSLGGAVAAALAADKTLDVASLTLLSPAGLGPEINGAFLNGITRAREPESLKAWLALLVSDASLVTDAFARAAWRGREDEVLLAAQEAMADALFPDATQTASVRALVEGLACPVRVLVGLEDRVIPPAQALSLTGAVALHRLKGVGHAPHLEAPDLVARLIRQSVASAL